MNSRDFLLIIGTILTPIGTAMLVAPPVAWLYWLGGVLIAAGGGFTIASRIVAPEEKPSRPNPGLEGLPPLDDPKQKKLNL